jgi:hypothetical protein
MNPFELQAQFARQWLDLAQTMTTSAMTACTGQETARAPATPAPAPAAPAPAATTFTVFPWLQGMSAFAPQATSAPAAAPNPWAFNPFTAWMNLFKGGAPAPAATPFAVFPWLQGPWLQGMAAFTPQAFSAPAAPNPWTFNPFASWMSLFARGAPAPAAMPQAAFMQLPFAQAPFMQAPFLQSPFGQAPFLQAMTQLMAPWWTYAAFSPWATPFAGPQQNPGAQLAEQIATNYRTASGYAAAAVVGPLGVALDPRTYGEPWWQSFDKGRKLN